MNAFRRACALSILALFPFGCSGSSETPPVDEGRFVDLFVRVERLHRHYAASPDSLRAEREKLFRAEGLKGEDLERAISWYRDHPERAAQVLEKIAARLEADTEKKNTEYRMQNTGEKPKP